MQPLTGVRQRLKESVMDGIPYVLRISVLCGMLLGGYVVGLAQAGEPLDKVRATVNVVLTVLSDKSLQGPEHTQARRDKMRQAVFQRFGFAEMAHRALGPHWRKRTAAEKQTFIALFGELLERSYINKIESYTGEQAVTYTKETVDPDGFASVVSNIAGKHDLDVVVEYRLLRRDHDWQIYDVVIEGVSLVNNYRTQFNNVISQESYEALVKKLQMKLERERAASSAKG